MFPSPDPHEQYTMMPTGIRAPAPMAIYTMGPATPRTDRVANRILDLRPGILVVLAQA